MSELVSKAGYNTESPDRLFEMIESAWLVQKRVVFPLIVVTNDELLMISSRSGSATLQSTLPDASVGKFSVAPTTEDVTHVMIEERLFGASHNEMVPVSTSPAGLFKDKDRRLIVPFVCNVDSSTDSSLVEQITTEHDKLFTAEYAMWIPHRLIKDLVELSVAIGTPANRPIRYTACAIIDAYFSNPVSGV